MEVDELQSEDEKVSVHVPNQPQATSTPSLSRRPLILCNLVPSTSLEDEERVFFPAGNIMKSVAHAPSTDCSCFFHRTAHHPLPSLLSNRPRKRDRGRSRQVTVEKKRMSKEPEICRSRERWMQWMNGVAGWVLYGTTKRTENAIEKQEEGEYMKAHTTKQNRKPTKRE